MNNLGAVLAALLTLFILSYLIGDNPFYRLAASLFVGLTAGYAVVVALSNVIWPQMITPLLTVLKAPENFDVSRTVLAVIAFILSMVLIFKLFASTTRPASCVTALMVGVGVAVAVGGTLAGTLIPQVQAAFIPLWSTKGTASFLESLAETEGGYDFLFSRQAMGAVGTYLESWFHLLPKIQCPTLLVQAGDAEDSELTDEVTAKMASMLPNCTLRKIDNAGHMVYADNPGAFYPILDEFLAGLG